MGKAFEKICIMTALAIATTGIALLAQRSMPAAMILTWVPVVLIGTYQIGKAKGRERYVRTNRINK